MSFLVYDEVTEKVSCTPEGMLLEEVQDLYNSDKRGDNKPWFNKCITYIYHVYKKDHIFSNSSLPVRRKKVCKDLMNDIDPDKFESNERVKALIKRYVNEQYTPSEWFYEGIKQDMLALKQHIRNIPFHKDIKVKKTVEVSLFDGEKEIQRSVEVDIDEKMDNSKEKMDALKRANELLDLEEKIRLKIIKENKETKRRKSSATLLEQGAFGNR